VLASHGDAKVSVNLFRGWWITVGKVSSSDIWSRALDV
jgi:hypothetical protein